MTTATANEITCTLPRRFPWQARSAGILAADTARFIVLVMGRRAGKTTFAADAAGEAALDRGQEVFWGAPTHDTAAIGAEKFLQFFRPACRRVLTMPASAETVTGGRVVWRSFDRPGAALGRGIDLAIIDEAARVKQRIVYEDLLPTVADTGGKILAITTPRGRHSWVFEWVQKARAGDPLYAVVHGPSTENPSPEVREFVEIARENMPDALFRQEILAEFVEGEGVVFRNIAACARLEAYRDAPRPGSNYAIGCDLAKHQDYTVMYAIDLETGEVHGRERFNKLDWTVIEQRIRNFSATWGGSVWLDSTGVGDPIFDRLANAGLPVVSVKFTNESKSALVVALMNALEKQEISFPADPVLVGELEAFAYEPLPSGKFRYSAPEGMHDDCVIALALAVMGRNRSSGPIMELL